MNQLRQKTAPTATQPPQQPQQQQQTAQAVVNLFVLSGRRVSSDGQVPDRDRRTPSHRALPQPVSGPLPRATQRRLPTVNERWLPKELVSETWVAA